MEPMLPVQPVGPETCHVTAELNVPVPFTVALNCAVAPIVTFALVGVRVTPVIALTGGGVTVLTDPPPHPKTKLQTAKTPPPAQFFIRILPINLHDPGNYARNSTPHARRCTTNFPRPALS